VQRRTSNMDALGRITTVYQDPSGPNYVTSYGYDAQGNLTSVSQGQGRTFTRSLMIRCAG
jgi:YD repeat-containing protein